MLFCSVYIKLYIVNYFFPMYSSNVVRHPAYWHYSVLCQAPHYLGQQRVTFYWIIVRLFVRSHLAI